MKIVELSSGESLELPDGLTPYDVRDIRDAIKVDGNTNQIQNLGTMMLKIVEVVLDKADAKVDIENLSQEDVDKIANKYTDEIQGFQG